MSNIVVLCLDKVATYSNKSEKGNGMLKNIPIPFLHNFTYFLFWMKCIIMELIVMVLNIS